jgi:hypothetical protein
MDMGTTVIYGKPINEILFIEIMYYIEFMLMFALCLQFRPQSTFPAF